MITFSEFDIIKFFTMASENMLSRQQSKIGHPDRLLEITVNTGKEARYLSKNY
jgi:hypothetical protein